MSDVFYEKIAVGKLNLLLGYTKDSVVKLEFNISPLSEKNFFKFLDDNFEKVIENQFRSDFAAVVEDYLNAKSTDLNVPVKLIGAEFNKRVWNEMMKIPFGEVRSYSEIAKAVGSEKASRAVGNANNKNNIVLIVPCHRIIGSDKNLVGFAPGLEYKVDLLELEGHTIVKKESNKSKKILYYISQ